MKISDVMQRLKVEQIALYEKAIIWREATSRGLSWQEAVVDRKAIEEAAHLMTSYALEVFKRYLLSFGSSPVDEERFVAMVREGSLLAGAEIRLGLRQLEEAGLLLAVRKVWGERIIFIVQESYAIWMQLLFPCKIPNFTSSNMMPITDNNGQFARRKEAFGRKMLYALAALSKSDMTLTSKGTLPKKTVAKMVEQMDMNEEPFCSFGLKWAHSDVYSLLAAFVLEAAGAIGILKLKENMLIIEEDNLVRWLGMKDEHREQQLMEWTCRQLFNFAGEHAKAAAAMLGMEKGQWFKALDIECWCNGLESATEANDREEQFSKIWTERFLLLFHEMGWMELAEMHENGEESRVFCWNTFEAPSQEKLIIQPNGELIVMPGCSFDVRFELELISERMNIDSVVLYNLTRKSIATAIEHGRSKEMIIGFLLAANCEGGIPDSVLSMLEEWTKRAGRFCFAEVMLLRCDSVEMVESALQLKELAPHLIERVGEVDFIIDSSKKEDIRHLLQKAGYPPLKGVQRGSERTVVQYPIVANRSGMGRSDEALMSCRNDAGLFLYESLSLSHFELDQDTMKQEWVLFPGAEQLPTVWWQQLRNYHASTRKELIQQAVNLQAAVQLNVMGNLRTFVPHQLEKRGEEWAVLGRFFSDNIEEKSRLTPDMWEEMKLLIPDGYSM